MAKGLAASTQSTCVTDGQADGQTDRISAASTALSIASCGNHHHHDAKRSAWAFRRCDCPPETSVLCQYESLLCRHPGVLADLVRPCGVRSAAWTSPVWTRPGSISDQATQFEYLVCWDSVRHSGNMTEETQPTFTDNASDWQQAGTTEDLCVGYEVVPLDVQDTALTL